VGQRLDHEKFFLYFNKKKRRSKTWLSMAGASWFLNREAIRQRFLSPRESNRKNKNLAHKTRGIEWCLGYPPMVYRPTSGSSSKETKNMTPEVAFAHLQLHSILFFFNIGSRLFHFVSSTSLQMPGCGIY